MSDPDIPLDQETLVEKMPCAYGAWRRLSYDASNIVMPAVIESQLLDFFKTHAQGIAVTTRSHTAFAPITV